MYSDCMGIFSFLSQSSDTAPKKQEASLSEDEVVHALIEIGTYSGDESLNSQANMNEVLEKIEPLVNANTSSRVLYWLGIVWRNYTAWHIRGDARKPYLEKAIGYYKRAFDKSKEEWPIQQSADNRHDAAYLDQITIASDLGTLLVEEKLVRDLDEAKQYLGFVAVSTDGYEPCLCHFAELYYKNGEFEKCIAIALKVHDRAVKSAKIEWEESKEAARKWKELSGEANAEQDNDWHNFIPTMPLATAGKALRALGRQAKKDGNIEVAKKYFGKIIELNIASETDKRIYERL